MNSVKGDTEARVTALIVDMGRLQVEAKTIQEKLEVVAATLHDLLGVGDFLLPAGNILVVEWDDDLGPSIRLRRMRTIAEALNEDRGEPWRYPEQASGRPLPPF